VQWVRALDRRSYERAMGAIGRRPMKDWLAYTVAVWAALLAHLIGGLS
jgi:hypothetical protein